MPAKGPDSIKGVIFDLDGTLVESTPAHIKSWIRAVAEFGVEATEDEVRPHMGRSSEDICCALLGRRPRNDIERAYCLKDDIYYDIIPQVIVPVPGAIETVAELKERGYLISIASSNPMRVIERSLASVGLRKYADSIASQDEVRRGKPAPDLFLLAQSKIGLGAGNLMAVGDTCFDVLAAKAAGMSTAAFSGGCQTEDQLGESQPDYLITDLRHLLDLLPGGGTE
jgi:HAD superfamily hydrolase (TIGR01509 family)